MRERERALEEPSEADSIFSGAKSEFQPEAGIVMPCYIGGPKYAFRLADVLFPTLDELLLLLRVRGRPARRAGL